MLLDRANRTWGFESHPIRLSKAEETEVGWLAYAVGLNLLVDGLSWRHPGGPRVLLTLPGPPVDRDLDVDAILAGLEAAGIELP
jgi:hypothetical protein